MDKPVMLITGARKGLGRYLVEYYVARGFQVAGCSRGEAQFLAGYEHFRVDVSDEEAVLSLFSALRKRYGKLDALINNAGLASMNHVLLTPVRTVRDILSTNVVGCFLFSREAAKLMRKGGGRIVNIGSFGVPLQIEGEAAYLASKGAVVCLSQIMARELAEFGITVNVVGPTALDTDMLKGVSPEKLRRLVDRLAIRQPACLADVSNVIDFFLQPTSSQITGQVIYLGGAS